MGYYANMFRPPPMAQNRLARLPTSSGSGSSEPSEVCRARRTELVHVVIDTKKSYDTGIIRTNFVGSRIDYRKNSELNHRYTLSALINDTWKERNNRRWNKSSEMLPCRADRTWWRGRRTRLVLACRWAASVAMVELPCWCSHHRTTGSRCIDAALSCLVTGCRLTHATRRYRLYSLYDISIEVEDAGLVVLGFHL